MAKRKSLGDEWGSPDSDVDDSPRMTKRGRVFRTSRVSINNTTSCNPWTPPRHNIMSDLLEFMITHEDAFKSRNRLASLYSDFRSQLATNPDGYYANVAAWKKALADAARAGVIPTQGGHDLLNIKTGEELARALQHGSYGRPVCLPAVFHDAVSKKEMIPLKDFLGAQSSIYKSSWVPSPWSVLQWGLRTVGVLGQPGFGDKLELGNFVVLSNVEAAANEVLSKMDAHTSAVDRIVSRNEFLKRYATVLNPAVPLSSNDLNILLIHLARDKQAISYDKQTIKFKSEKEVLPLPITQEDTAIAQLRDTIAKINAQLEPLSEKVSSFNLAAREAVKSKQIIRAKAALRSKKLAESALAQRTDVSMQLEGVYAKLEEAADQIEIVEAMRMSAVALKGLNKKVGGVEGVEGVVDALREEMSTADEISNMINEAGEPVDEGEIDDELEELERAEREKKEAIERAAREKKEAEGAAKTAARLAELEVLEMERKAKEAEKEKQKAKEAEAAKEKERKENDEAKEDLDMSQSLARLSFVEEPKEDVEEEKIPEAA